MYVVSVICVLIDATEHSLLYNAIKSYSLCLKATTIKFERQTLNFGQISIPNATDCKYLGILRNNLYRTGSVYQPCNGRWLSRAIYIYFFFIIYNYIQ